jgi:hypothetical protein
MKKVSTLVMALFLVAVCFCQAQAVTVLIAPDTLVIDEGDTEFTLTVHAEISCSVDKEDVSLAGLDNDIGADSTGCDSRGQLVAKFTVGIDDLPDEEGDVTLELIVGGDSIGSDTISIIDKTDEDPGGPDDKTKNQDGNREGAQD